MIKQYLKLVATDRGLRTLILLVTFISSQTAIAQQQCFEQLGVPRTTPNADFELVNDEVVIHKKTGLMWQRCPVGYEFNGENCKLSGSEDAANSDWVKALTLANRQNFAGFSGWRLPNIKELVSIAEEGCMPNINLEAFPFVALFEQSSAVSFWSSSPAPGRATGSNRSRSYRASFHESLSFTNPISISHLEQLLVLLVRDTQADFVSTMAPAFEHPRCQNCHAVEGTNFVSGTVSGVGLPLGHPSVNSSTPNSTCEGCHTSDLQPPGDIDPGWHAAPLSNDLRNLTVTELCERAKLVPSSANDAHHHLTEDRLILWAFEPERPFNLGLFEPAPPYNVEAWKDTIDVWRDAGLPCPGD